MDHNWDDEKFKSDDLKSTVKQINVCAYRNPRNEGDGEMPPTNHWATFLEISEKHSVRLDMAPGYGSDGLRGKIQISTKNYRITSHAIYGLSFEPNGKLKVRDIVRLINDNKLQKYNFTPELEGCRFWIYTFISCLEEQGVIQSGSASTTWNAVSYYYRNPSGHELRDVKRGTFRS